MGLNRVLYCLFLIAFTLEACAVSKKRDGQEPREEDARVFDSSTHSTSGDAADPASGTDAGGDDEIANGGAAASGPNPSGGTTGGSGSGSPNAICGNGIVERTEACDDGNFEPRDGCTAICEISCQSDDDCDDMNDCNGVEICTLDGACDDSDPDLEQGAECGERRSCWQGVCIPNICGDAKRDPGELCDDGNLDPDDGCTPDCEFTCEDNSDCAGKDACLGDLICEDHKCVGGDALDDKTPCTIVDERTKSFCGNPEVEKDGWCMMGRCTCDGCGDGLVEGVEECDEVFSGGAEIPGNCSHDCRVVDCGNGVLEGDEACDDGNDRPMDGCDPDCQYEFAHRLTHIEILKGVEVPKWCEHRGNRFADAFAEKILIMGVMPYEILEDYNRKLSRNTARDHSFLVLQVLNSDDASMRTSDSEIAIGLYRSSPYDLSMEHTIDMPVLIEANQLDRETLLPTEYHRVPAFQAGGGRILSSEPTTVEMASATGDFGPVRDFMLQLVFDMSTLSRPDAQPVVLRDTIRVSEDIRLPELAGQNPTGVFCGAIGPQWLSDPIVLPNVDEEGRMNYVGSITSTCCKNRGEEFAMPYRHCETGVLTDRCESTADMIRQGCSVCTDMTNPELLPSIADLVDLNARCALMKSHPEWCYNVIEGIDYDVDSDNDGENDSWSALFGFETQRVRIYDVKER